MRRIWTILTNWKRARVFVMVKPEKVGKIDGRSVVVVYKKDGTKNVWVWDDFEKNIQIQGDSIDYIMAIESL